MNRSEVLKTAHDLITGDRAKDYGSFGDQMIALSRAFNLLHHGDPDAPELRPKDVSTLLMLLKLKRRLTASGADSQIDLAGYAALDAEFFSSEAGVPQEVPQDLTRKWDELLDAANRAADIDRGMAERKSADIAHMTKLAQEAMEELQDKEKLPGYKYETKP